MIRRIRAKNFKSLKDVSLPLARRNVLVGPNMSGKSNLIWLFRFLSQMVYPAPGAYGLASAFTALGGFGDVVWKGEGSSNFISIGLEGDFSAMRPGGEETTWNYELEILGDPRGALLVQEESLTYTPPGGPPLPLIVRDSSSGFRTLRNAKGGVVSNLSENTRSALEYEIPDWEGSQIRTLLASFRYYSLVPRSMKQLNPTAAVNFLDEVGGNLSSWLLHLQTRYREESFEKINNAVKDIFPDLTSIFTWPTPQSTVFVASSERFLQRPIPIWHMSDGELCFIALLSLIFSPLELGAPLYCIEEPENHLHPRLLEVLVGLLDQVQEKIKGPKAQIVVTTHSPLLVDKVRLDDLVIVQKKAGESIFVRASEKQNLRDLLVRGDLGLGDWTFSGALSGA